MLQVVSSEPQSPFEALWLEFPELDCATCVGRMSYSGDERWGVVRTFRLLNGSYLRIHSWGRKDGSSGNKPEVIPVEEHEVYEDVWQNLMARSRLYDAEDPMDERTGIRAASYEYMVAVEDSLDDFSMEDEGDEAEDE